MYHHIARLLFIALIVCGPMILDAQEQAWKIAIQLRAELENNKHVALCPPDVPKAHNRLEKYLTSTSDGAIESRIALGIDYLQEMPIRVLENPNDADKCAYFNSLFRGVILNKSGGSFADDKEDFTEFYPGNEYDYYVIYYKVGDYYFVVIESTFPKYTKQGYLAIRPHVGWSISIFDNNMELIAAGRRLLKPLSYEEKRKYILNLGRDSNKRD